MKCSFLFAYLYFCIVPSLPLVISLLTFGLMFQFQNQRLILQWSDSRVLCLNILSKFNRVSSTHTSKHIHCISRTRGYLEVDCIGWHHLPHFLKPPTDGQDVQVVTDAFFASLARTGESWTNFSSQCDQIYSMFFLVTETYWMGMFKLSLMLFLHH